MGPGEIYHNYGYAYTTHRQRTQVLGHRLDRRAQELVLAAGGGQGGSELRYTGAQCGGLVLRALPRGSRDAALQHHQLEVDLVKDLLLLQVLRARGFRGKGED